MRRAREASIGLSLVAALCLLLMGLTAGVGQEVTGTLAARLDLIDPTIFTVVAVAPFELRMMGPQALTLTEAETLREQLKPIAEMALVSILRVSDEISMIKDGRETLLWAPQQYLAVGENYFSLMRLVVADGRTFTPEEVVSGAYVCVVGADREERSFHSNTQGKMNATYRVVGRLQPAQGYQFPPPKIWREPEGSYPFYPILNEMVFTPITARAPVSWSHPLGIQEPPTWVVPLVAPYPGQYEAAIAAVTRVMEEKWPGWALDFGYGNEMSVVLGGTTSRVETFFSYIRALLLALFLVSTAAFMVLHVVKDRRAMALRCALGGTRALLVLSSAGYAAGLSVTGAALGFALLVAARPWLSGYLGQPIALAPGTALAYTASIVGVAVIASTVTVFSATARDPGQGLRRGSVISGRRAFDVRLPLAVTGFFLALACVATMLLAGRASIASLGAYLRSAGERTLTVRQDFSAVTRTLTTDDLIGPPHAARLRSALPADWSVVCQTVATVTIVTPAGNSLAAFAYGLDRLWPEGTGFGVGETSRATWDSPGSPDVALVGSDLAVTLFGVANPIGQVLDLGRNVKVEIIGVLDRRPANVVDSLGDRDDCLVLPSAALARVADLMPGTAITEISVFVPEGCVLDQAVTTAQATLDASGCTEIGLKASAVLGEVADLTRLRTRMGVLQVALAYATLAASALMLGLTIQARVAERRRELGLKRALGARPFRVASEILAQTLGWCALAGAAGLAAGTALASRICGLEGWVPPDPAASLLQLALSVALAGVLAALWPLSAALGEDPLVSLREGE